MRDTLPGRNFSYLVALPRVAPQRSDGSEPRREPGRPRLRAAAHGEKQPEGSGDGGRKGASSPRCGPCSEACSETRTLPQVQLFLASSISGGTQGRNERGGKGREQPRRHRHTSQHPGPGCPSGSLLFLPCPVSEAQKNPPKPQRSQISSSLPSSLSSQDDESPFSPGTKRRRLREPRPGRKPVKPKPGGPAHLCELGGGAVVRAAAIQKTVEKRE